METPSQLNEWWWKPETITTRDHVRVPYIMDQRLSGNLYRVLNVYFRWMAETADLKSLPSDERQTPHILRALPKDDRDNILSIKCTSLAGYRAFKTVFRCPIVFIPVEVLLKILEFNNPRAKDIYEPTKRAFLSVESFATTLTTPPLETAQVTSIKDFRLVCHFFSNAARDRLFTRVTARFDQRAFYELGRMACEPNIAKDVKKFSYMVPRIYPQELSRFQQVLNTYESRQRQLAAHQNPDSQRSLRMLRKFQIGRQQIMAMMARVKQHQEIIDANLDQETIRYALMKFPNLVQIRLMKLVDRDIDGGWDKFISNNSEYAAEFRAVDWTVSYERAIEALSIGFKHSKSTNLNRFSSRFLNPRLPIVLTPSLTSSIAMAAACLTTLELELSDDRIQVDQRIPQLSPLFEVVFQYAKQLQSIHIGANRQISTPLESIFHGVQFQMLTHIGLHMWLLDSDELIALIRRHKSRLRSLRLRYVSIRQPPGSDSKEWQKVLRFIRLELVLKWISLRHIGYENQQVALGGMQFGPTIHGHFSMDSDSESDFDDDDDDEENDAARWSDSNDDGAQEDNEGEDVVIAATEESDEHHTEDGHDEDAGDEESDHDSDHDTFLDDSILEVLHDDTSPSSPVRDRGHGSVSSRCGCESGYGYADLDDNGTVVSKDQWQRWQTWVVEKRCPAHDHAAALRLAQ